jgi:sugar transferase (PEP-CTERM/EpsH1 system associated)
MNILFLTPRCPYPPYQGDRVKAYHLLKYLSKKHRLFLLTFLERRDDQQYIEKLREFCAEVHTVYLPRWRSVLSCAAQLFRQEPFQVAYYCSAEFEKKISELLSTHKIDLIHTHLLRMMPYTLTLRQYPRVIDLTDAISLYLSRYAEQERNPFKKFAISVERDRVLSYESLAASFDRCFVCSEKDKAYLQSKLGLSNIEVTFNCVDFKTNQRDNHNEAIFHSIIFAGNFSYPPNADAAMHLATRLFPKIRERMSDAKLLLVGRKPSKDLVRLSNNHIIVTGYVEDMNQWYRKATIAVSPIRFGAGTLNKVLEPMALGKLVVATPIGVEGIGLRDGRDIIFCKNDDDFVDKTVAALQSEALRSKIGQTAQETIATRFGCSAVVDHVSNIYEKVLQEFQEKTMVLQG